MQTNEELTEANVGCWLDNHRGHYISRDVIQLAQHYGFIVSLSDQWVIDTYDNFSHYEDYPTEAIHELCDDAIVWLNSGQTVCEDCEGRGEVPHILPDNGGATSVICKACSGTGRGDRVQLQNFPPKLPDAPDGYSFQWAFEDGDFGIWLYDDEGEVVDLPLLG